LTPASPTTEVTISAYVPHPELFAAAEWSTHASERGWDEASFEALLMSGFGQSPGALSPDGRSVLGQEALFIPLLGPPIPSPLPVWRGTFTATDFAQPREIAIWTRTDLF